MEVQVLRYYKYVPAFQMEVFSFWIHTCVSLHKTSVIIWSVVMSFECLNLGWTKQNDQNYNQTC